MINLKELEVCDFVEYDKKRLQVINKVSEYNGEKGCFIQLGKFIHNNIKLPGYKIPAQIDEVLYSPDHEYSDDDNIEKLTRVIITAEEVEKMLYRDAEKYNIIK